MSAILFWRRSFMKLCIGPIALLALSSVAAAQEAPRKPDDAHRLIVTLAAASPASIQFRLEPDPQELVPGDAATLYYRSLAALVEWESVNKDLKDTQWATWLKAPLRDFPQKLVQERLVRMGHLL